MLLTSSKNPTERPDELLLTQLLGIQGVAWNEKFGNERKIPVRERRKEKDTGVDTLDRKESGEESVYIT